MEDALIGLDKNSKRLLHESGLHLVLVVLSDGSRCGNLYVGLITRLVQTAARVVTLTRGVGVIRLELSVVTFEVSVGPERIATVAAHVKVDAGGAINELLL